MKKKLLIIFIITAVLAAVICVLTFGGAFEKEDKTSSTTTTVEKYVEEGRIDLKNLLNDSSIDTISAYLGKYTYIAEINNDESISEMCNMLLNDIEIITDEAQINEFKSFVEDNYGPKFLSLYFRKQSENMVLIKIYDESHIYISAKDKEFVSYTSCVTDLDQMYLTILSNRLDEKVDTTKLNTHFSLINETASSISMYSSSGEFIDYADIDKLTALQGEAMLYVMKYDFIYSSEALFYSYEYLKCEEQINSGTLFIVKYQNGSESCFYLGTDNKIYYINESGNVFVSEKEYFTEGYIK